MRIVVFGAGGGVGRRAVAAAAEQGHDIVAAARSSVDVPAAVQEAAVDVRDADAYAAPSMVRTRCSGASG